MKTHNHFFCIKHILIIFTVLIAFVFFNGCSTPSSSEDKKVNCDWLVMCYLDGDNNLLPEIYLKVKQLEQGLRNVKKINPDASIKVVALFDGIRAENTSKENYARAEWMYNNGILQGTHFLEIGPDDNEYMYSNYKYDSDPDADGLAYYGLISNQDFLSNYYKNIKISSNTKTFSFSPCISSDSDMSNPETLKRFLVLANSIYKPNHSVLIISDHGAGPTSRTSLRMNSKSVCIDETWNGNEQIYITTTELGQVLASCGYGSQKKLDLIALDACLEGAVENAFELSPYADYMIASPNSEWMTTFPFVSLINAIGGAQTVYERTLTPEDFNIFQLSKNVSEIIGSSQVTNGKDLSKVCAYCWGLKDYMESILRNYVTSNFYPEYKYFPTETSSAYDLSKSLKVAECMNFLSEELLKSENENLRKKLTYKDGRYFSTSQFGKWPVGYLCAEYWIDVPSELKKAYDLAGGIRGIDYQYAYNGIFTYLYDIYKFAESIESDVLATDSIKKFTTDLKSALKEMVIYSYKFDPEFQVNTSSDLQDISRFYSSNVYGADNTGYGITVSVQRNVSFIDSLYKYPVWYDDFAFSKAAQNWNRLLIQMGKDNQSIYDELND